MSDPTLRVERRPLDAAYQPEAVASGNSRRSQIARAGLAVPQFHPDGSEYKAILTVVPGFLPQNAAVAEKLSVFFADS